MLKYILLFVCFTLFASMLHAQEMYKVTADKLNIRETEKSNSKIIGFIPEDENVMVLDSSKVSVFKVRVTNGEGWVASKFLQRINAPKKQEVKAQSPVVKDSKGFNYGSLYLPILFLIGAIIVWLLYKYTKGRQFLIWATLIIALIVVYLTYLEFFKPKLIIGRYATTTEQQFKSFDFATKDSVTVTASYLDSTFKVPYSIKNSVIKFSDGQNTIMLLIVNENTLEGEGFTSGTYKKL